MRVAEFWIVTACLYKTNNHEAMTAAVCVLKTIIEQRDGVLDLQSIRLATADAAGKQSEVLRGNQTRIVLL